MSTPAQGQPGRAAPGANPAYAPPPAPGTATAATQGAAPATATAANATATAAPAAQVSTTSSPPATTSAPQPRRSSTPARLRLARGLATAAALLTGIVATGTFDTSGVNATPNVIASQWVAAERAGVELSEADLAAAQAVTESVAGSQESTDDAADSDTPPLPAFAEHLRDAASHNARAGSDAAHASSAQDIVDAGLLAQSALQQAPQDSDAAAQAYASSSEAARRAVASSNASAVDAAHGLNTGSRSGLTAVVGGVATLVMLGILVWLALATRRMVNVPLLVATAITGWLTYVSLNPSALPVNYDQQVGDASRTATALEEVLQARQAQYAVALGLEDRVADEVREATAAVNALGPSSITEAWHSATDGVDAIVKADGTQARLEVIKGSEKPFTTTVEGLRAQLDDRLSPAVSGVGTTATITAGVALLLGVVAAALGWAGISQRLRDYR